MGTSPSIDPGLGAAWGVLGLAADADRVQVTRAYRRLARVTHPDVSPNPDAAARFAAIANAYRRAIEAVQEQGDGLRRDRGIRAASRWRRRSETSPWSAGGVVWVHVSTPVAQMPLGAESTEMMLRWSRLGGARLGYSSRCIDAPIVAGPVQVQPLSDTNRLDGRDPATRSRTPAGSVWPCQRRERSDG